MRRRDSLRLRLVAAMAVVFAFGVAAAVIAAPFEADAAAGLSEMLDEPYQDIALLVPFGAVMLALLWVVAGWSLRPVRAASRQAAAVGPGNLDARVSVSGLPAEVRPLVEAFNHALDRLSDAYAAERRFVADAAHELRTPLSVLSLRLQRARHGALDWELIEGDVDRVNRLTGQLLDLAHKSHGARAGAGPGDQVTDLARIGREAAALAIPLAEEANRAIVVDLPLGMAVSGVSNELRDAVRNLLDNAVLHGRGTVSLAGWVERRRDVPLAWLEVGDEGPGVPPGLETAVFERFRKADPNTSGHGLGLSIVRETIRTHGGDIEILPGAGCRVRLALPLADASS